MYCTCKYMQVHVLSQTCTPWAIVDGFWVVLCYPPCLLSAFPFSVPYEGRVLSLSSAVVGLLVCSAGLRAFCGVPWPHSRSWAGAPSSCWRSGDDEIWAHVLHEHLNQYLFLLPSRLQVYVQHMYVNWQKACVHIQCKLNYPYIQLSKHFALAFA